MVWEGGESWDDGGEGYSSGGGISFLEGISLEVWIWNDEAGGRCCWWEKAAWWPTPDIDCPQVRPYTVPEPTIAALALVYSEIVSGGGDSVPNIIRESAFVVGSIMSFAASILLSFFSPLSTSPLALLYM